MKIIAEIGINHDGSMKRAKDLILLAHRSGADYVKLQCWHPRDFTTPADPLWDQFVQCAMSITQVLDLIDFGKKNGVTVFTSVTKVEDVPWLEGRVPFIKLGSDEIENWPLIEAVLKLENTPLMISLGMADGYHLNSLHGLSFRNDARDRVIRLECESSYPATVEGFRPQGWPGISTHVQPERKEHILDAVRWAKYVEVHFTDNRDRPGPDHSWSYGPDDLLDLRESLDALASIGTKPPETKAMQYKYLRSAYVAEAMKAGDVIGVGDVKFLRPGTGIRYPEFMDKFHGATLARDVEAMTMLKKEDFE